MAVARDRRPSGSPRPGLQLLVDVNELGGNVPRIMVFLDVSAAAHSEFMPPLAVSQQVRHCFRQ